MMHIAFRVDSSTTIGHGHVMRCMTLAHAFLRSFKTKNENKPSTQDKHTHAPFKQLLISFLCRSDTGNINKKILDEGFQLLELCPAIKVIEFNNTNSWLGASEQEDVKECVEHIKTLPPITLLVVDHYAIDYKWQSLFKPYYKKLLVIDDLANRRHNCDYLIDQTYQRNKNDYKTLVPEKCSLLLGDKYMLLRDEFSTLHKLAKTRRATHCKRMVRESTNQNTRNSPTTILITMGGSDPDNLSQQVLFSLEKLIQKSVNLLANIVISRQSTHLKSLALFCQQHTWATLIIDSNNMAELMLEADIGIGACGGTAWERCTLGLPCLTTINAKNQQLIANNLETQGAIVNLGWFQDITTNIISDALETLLQNTNAYKNMVKSCFDVCDGIGASRVADIIITKLIKERPIEINTASNAMLFREATSDDCELTFHWQSNNKIRQYFINPETPSWEEHTHWYNACLMDKNRALFILQDVNNNNLGLLRLDKITLNGVSIDSYEVSIIISPEHQGQGHAVNTLKKLKKLKENAIYIATIDKRNKASQQAFIKAGFKRTSSSSYRLAVYNSKVKSG